MAYLLMRGQTLARIVDRKPAMVGGYTVMEWPDDTLPSIGQMFDGAAFVDPPAPKAKPKPARTVLTPPEFKRLFTLEERIAIAAAREGGDTPEAKTLKRALDVFYEDIDDPRTQVIDVTHPDVTAGLDYLVTAGLIKAARRTKIAKGVVA